jgi:hypothetical protein
MEQQNVLEEPLSTRLLCLDDQVWLREQEDKRSRELKNENVPPAK